MSLSRIGDDLDESASNLIKRDDLVVFLIKFFDLLIGERLMALLCLLFYFEVTVVEQFFQIFFR